MAHDKLAVVACEVLKNELAAVINGRDIPLYLIDQGLHRTPKIMPGRIMEKICLAQSEGATHLALGYGLCSNGVVGVGAEEGRSLVVPRCHDCIAMLVGSRAAYLRMFRQHPGTYYLSSGWLEVGKDPLSIMEQEYTQTVGPEDARWVMETELIHYTRFCFLDNGLGAYERNRKRIVENCVAFGKRYEEVRCSLDYFHTLIDGPHPASDFITLDGGRCLDEAFFLNPA